MYREYPADVYRHGQYEDVSQHLRLKAHSVASNKVFYMDPLAANDVEAFDDFYSPIEPESYIRHRLLPQLHFYQSRCSARVSSACLALRAESADVQGAPIFGQTRFVAARAALNVCR